MAVNLQVAVTKSIIIPGVNETSLKRAAKELSLDVKTESDLTLLRSHVITKVLAQISKFLVTQEATDLYPHASGLSVKPVYIKDITEQLDKTVDTLFPILVNQEATATQSSWPWPISLIM